MRESTSDHRPLEPSIVARGDWLRDLLPSGLETLFDASFIRSHRLYGEFVYRVVLEITREMRLDEAMRTPAIPEEIVRRAGLAPSHALVPVDWMLRLLAARQALDASADGSAARYQSRGPLQVLDPMAIREEQVGHDASWMPAYVLTETVARDYPAFLRGEITGDEVLFSPRRLRLWVDYFSNDNGLYAVNNRVGAVAAEPWLPQAGGVVLELGGGLGSGALALLERLDAADRLDAIRGYRFTEFVPAFLRRGEHTLRTRYPALSTLTCASLDMNRSFASQGVPAESVDLVYAVNTIHVAHDLEFTLGEVFRVLVPGGRVVASECVRPRPRQPLDAEFVFNLAESFRAPRLHPVYRPNGGFLTPEQWTAALEAAGFGDVAFVPDVRRIRERIPDFTIAAVVATRPG